MQKDNNKEQFSTFSNDQIYQNNQVLNADQTIEREINFGPQHPASHGVLRLILKLKGEVISAIDPDIGLLHRGTEKLIEYKTYMQALPYFDRLDYVSPMSQEHTFTLAIEKILNVKPPRRASYIRVLFCELTRILNHIMNITTQSLDLGASTPLLWLFEEREKIMEFYDQVSGARMHANYIRPGGVSRDIQNETLDNIAIFIDHFPKILADVETLLTENRIFKQRLVGIGVISSKDALDFALSGPMLRSSGINWDLRKKQPYEIYDELYFGVPIGKNGDCYDRYLIRIEEIKQSINIIKQVLNKIPKGDFLLDDRRFVPPTKIEMQNNMESMINHFKLFSSGYKLGPKEVYCATETPKGEFGVSLYADGTEKPYRCKIRAPSFFHLQAINKISSGYMLSDLVAILSSFDIVLGEVDR